MFSLRKGGILTRHDLETGQVYNLCDLSSTVLKSLTMGYSSDIIVVKSPKISLSYRTDSFFRFHVYQLHPFKFLATFDIDSSVFPGNLNCWLSSFVYLLKRERNASVCLDDLRMLHCVQTDILAAGHVFCGVTFS